MKKYLCALMVGLMLVGCASNKDKPEETKPVEQQMVENEKPAFVDRTKEYLEIDTSKFDASKVPLDFVFGDKTYSVPLKVNDFKDQGFVVGYYIQGEEQGFRENLPKTDKRVSFNVKKMLDASKDFKYNWEMNSKLLVGDVRQDGTSSYIVCNPTNLYDEEFAWGPKVFVDFMKDDRDELLSMTELQGLIGAPSRVLILDKDKEDPYQYFYAYETEEQVLLVKFLNEKAADDNVNLMILTTKNDVNYKNILEKAKN